MSEEKPILISDVLFKSSTIKGEVGIEVEVEGRNLPRDAGDYWSVTRDGSLRGEESFEYVLNSPIPREEVNKALAQLYSAFDKSSAVLDNSGRAGVHIHINIRDLTIKELYTFIFLYLILERPLVDFCGEDRIGNLFCLRAVDAEYLLVMLRNLVSEHNFRNVGVDNLRYSALNLTAIPKYGSLEFRAMASPVPQDKIEQWAQVLLAIKDAAKQFSNLEDTIYAVSDIGGTGFAKRVLGDSFPLITCEDWDQEVVFGMRLVQPIINNFSQKSLDEEEVRVREAIKKREAPPAVPEAENGVYPQQMAEVLRHSLLQARGEARFGRIYTI